ncbi:MAG: class I SAM-dependent methyltransferase [Candidatus Woesearchaeota archaeon]
MVSQKSGMVKFYAAIASGYEELYGEEQLKKLSIIADELKPREGNVILDVGCGIGLSARVFAPNRCRLIGIEPCKELAAQAPFEVKIARAEQIPFPDNSFDFVICVTALHNFDEPSTALKEMGRICKPTGKVAITVLKKAKNASRLTELIRKMFLIEKELNQEKDFIFVCKKQLKRGIKWNADI